MTTPPSHFLPFRIGICNCGCKEPLSHLRSNGGNRYLIRYKAGHASKVIGRLRKGCRPPNAGRNRKRAICRTCHNEFDYLPSNKAGLFCSNSCYRSNKEFLSEQGYKVNRLRKERGRMHWMKVTDEQILEIWETFKTTKRHLSGLFAKYGVKRVPLERILKLIPEGEYRKYQTNTRRYSTNAYLYNRGAHYERRAKSDLVKEGYLVVRSGGSKGIFDLWALGKGKLRLIQVKADRAGSNYSALQASLRKLVVPKFCSKELWIWRDRKGWKKFYLSLAIEQKVVDTPLIQWMEQQTA